jgi:hypothetical protein
MIILPRSQYAFRSVAFKVDTGAYLALLTIPRAQPRS